MKEFMAYAIEKLHFKPYGLESLRPSTDLQVKKHPQGMLRFAAIITKKVDPA